MPKYRFKGFSTGSAVAMIALQGGLTATASVPTWGVVSTASITVETRRSDLGVGSEMIGFQVTSWTGFDAPGPADLPAPAGKHDPRKSDLVYLWDFDDPGSEFLVPLRIPTAHRNANVAYGHAAAHLFAPGTYTPSLLVIEPSTGRIATWTSSAITVQDPDVFFAGKEVIVDTTGAGDYTTLQAALTAVRAQSDVRRIRLTRGQSFGFSTGFSMGGSWRNIWIDAVGSGADPVLLWTGATPTSGATYFLSNLNIMTGYKGGASALDLHLEGFKFQGPWNAANETGFNGGSLVGIANLGAGGVESDPFRPFWGGSPITHASIINVGSNGMGMTVDWREPNLFMGMYGLNLENWQDYGMLGEGGFVALLGSSLQQNPLAVIGGDKDFRHNNHGPGRLTATIALVCDGCQFFTNTGWSGLTAGWRAPQPNWRNQINTSTDVNNMVVQRCLFEGGLTLFAVGILSGGNYNGNFLIERSYFLGSYCNDELVGMNGGGGFTWRHNVFVQPNPTFILRSLQRFMTFAWQSGQPNGLLTRIERILIEHNTFVDLTTGGTSAPIFLMTPPSGGSIPVGASLEGLIIRNNVEHRPNKSSPVTTFAPLDTTPLITPRMTQAQRRLEVFTGTVPSGGIGPGESFTIPYSGGDFFSTTPGVAASYQPRYNGHDDGAHSFTLSATPSVVLTGVSGTITAGNTFTGPGSVLGTVLQVTGTQVWISFGNSFRPVSNQVWTFSGGASGTIQTFYPNGWEFTFEASAARLTNRGRTGDVWAAGTPYTVELERATTALPPPILTAATPAGSAAVYRPSEGSSARGGAADNRVKRDFYGSLTSSPNPWIGAIDAA